MSLIPTRLRRTEYQDETNVLGFNTTKNISHGFRVEQPLNNKHPVRTTIYDDKPMEMVVRNPFPLHDQFVTTNNVYHGPKWLKEIYFQPDHPLAPGSDKVDYIRPDFHRRVARGDFDQFPVYHLSETHDEFKPVRGYNNVYGAPTIYVPQRDVFLPVEKDFVYPFDKNDLYTVLRHVNPYIPTSHFHHRKFTPEELAQQEMLRQIEKSEKKSDVAIKYRVRPMHDPFEQKVYKDVCLSPDLEIKRKWYFKYPVYTGCPPRVFPPVEYIGDNSTYQGSYSAPFSSNLKENYTHPLKVCYLQPTISAVGAREIPNMYHSENTVYGSGRNLHTFYDLAKREHPKFDPVIHF